MVAARGIVRGQSILAHIGFHALHGGGLGGVGADMQALHAQPFCVLGQARAACVQLLLAHQLRFCPGEHIRGHETRLADHHCESEAVLARKVHARLVVRHAPQALQRRYGVLEVARRSVPVFGAHAHRVGEAVQQAHGALERAARLVGVAHAVRHEEGQGRHVDERGLGLGRVERLLALDEYGGFHGFILSRRGSGSRSATRRGRPCSRCRRCSTRVPARSRGSRSVPPS